MKIVGRALFMMALISFAEVTNAQVVLPPRGQEAGLRDNVFGLGLFGGAATGLGLIFRHHLPSSISYQITGGIIKANDRLSYDIGVEVQYDLVRGPSNRYFVGGGFGYYYSGVSDNEMSAPGRLAIGIGGEFVLTPGMHTIVELMFTYFTDGTILPLPQLGFHYYFY
jgi:hypothetical protein